MNKIDISYGFDFGKWLTNELESQKMSINKLAKISGLSNMSISKYRSGDTVPSLYNMIDIFDSLGYTVSIEKNS